MLNRLCVLFVLCGESLLCPRIVNHALCGEAPIASGILSVEATCQSPSR